APQGRLPADRRRAGIPARLGPRRRGGAAGGEHKAVRLDSRGCALASWQAEHVRRALAAAAPGLAVEIVILRTTGDRIHDVPLSRIGGTGLFTKEVDDALLDGRIDAAVHSLKDVPTRLPPGIVLGAILERADPADALVVAPGLPATLAALPPGA